MPLLNKYVERLRLKLNLHLDPNSTVNIQELQRSFRLHVNISLRGQAKHRLCRNVVSGNKDITAINSKITRKKAYQAVLKYAAFERTKQFALEYLICTLDSRNVTDDVQFLWTAMVSMVTSATNL